MLSQEKRREITFPTPSICSTSTQWNLWWNDRMGRELDVRLGVHRGWSFATRSTTLLVLPELSCGFSSTTNPVIGKGEDTSNVETFFPHNNCYIWKYIYVGLNKEASFCLFYLLVMRAEIGRKGAISQPPSHNLHLCHIAALDSYFVFSYSYIHIYHFHRFLYSIFSVFCCQCFISATLLKPTSATLL